MSAPSPALPAVPASLEPIDKLLFVGIMMFVVLLIVMERWSPNDGQLFQVISGCLTGFVGAFLGRMAPRAPTPITPPLGGPGTVTTVTPLLTPATPPSMAPAASSEQK